MPWHDFFHYFNAWNNRFKKRKLASCKFTDWFHNLRRFCLWCPADMFIFVENQSQNPNSWSYNWFKAQNLPEFQNLPKTSIFLFDSHIKFQQNSDIRAFGNNFWPCGIEFGTSNQSFIKICIWSYRYLWFRYFKKPKKKNKPSYKTRFSWFFMHTYM